MFLRFHYFCFFVALNFTLAQPQSAEGDCVVIEKTGAYGVKEYLACSKNMLDAEKEKAKTVDPTLLAEWQTKALEWKTTYKEDYPYPKPEKVKIKIVESKLSFMEAEKKARELTELEKKTYAVVKIMNENGSFYEVMTENESVAEYIREMKFYLKEWKRYHEKQKKRRPTKPSVRVVKSDFKTRDEAQEELLKLINENQ